VFRHTPLSPDSSDLGPTFPAGHGTRILRSDALDLRPMSRFTISRITGHHAVLIQEVQISTAALSSAIRCILA
jgi:hypothetical protein